MVAKFDRFHIEYAIAVTVSLRQRNIFLLYKLLET